MPKLPSGQNFTIPASFAPAYFDRRPGGGFKPAPTIGPIFKKTLSSNLPKK